jgi:CRISPR system Cascade subunit CasD
MDARKVDGKANKFPVVSRREYLFDAAFTVAVGSKPDAPIALAEIAAALRQPLYTPSLGRRSCPLARPLLEGEVEAEDALTALSKAAPTGGLVYSESQQSAQPLRLRDVPLHGHKRQFGTRLVYLHKETPCS